MLLPRVTSVDQPFWEGCNRNELVLQQCLTASCGKFVYYPRVCCPHCGGGELAWRRVSGRGRIVSFSLVHRPQHFSFQHETPIPFVAVELKEGPLLYSRLEGAVLDDSLIGSPVEVIFVARTEDQKLPYFRVGQADCSALPSSRVE